MAHRDSAFAVILRRDQVLVVKPRGQKKWALPAAASSPRKRPGSPRSAKSARETGLDARLLALTGMYRRRDGSLRLRLRRPRRLAQSP